MYIPSHWSKQTATSRTPRGHECPVDVWGWGDDAPTAKQNALERLQRMLDRIRSGEPFPSPYAYGTRPLREEILQTFESDGQPVAIVTRNAYGVQVLNTSSLLFLDVDRPPRTLRQLLPRWLGGIPAPPDDELLTKLRDALRPFANITFRLYRTAAGLRTIAADREFDPKGDEAQSLMSATGTDPHFARLCRAQGSFRARLTPKPWRCKVGLPPCGYPRDDIAAEQQFAKWLDNYERSSQNYATCAYVESIGDREPSESLAPLVELHDRLTRSNESLPLA